MRPSDTVCGADDIKPLYKKERNKKILFIVLMIAIAVVMFFLTLGVGIYHISIAESIKTFINHITGNIQNAENDSYIWGISTGRVPCALGAIVAGIGLSIGGAIMQNILKNPLAEPYTMGISSGAVFGASLSIGLGFSLVPFLTGSYSTMANAFIFSLVPLAMILLISMFRKLTPVMMVLMGIAIMYLFTSMTQVVMVSSNPQALQNIYIWLIGSLDGFTWDRLPMVTAVTAVLSILLYVCSSRLDVMYTGDKSAQSLGLKVNSFRLFVLMLTSFLTAAIVCTTGTIGFIGLVAPHVARIFVGSLNRYLIPASACFGAAFILIADTVSKATLNLPVGVYCALIGGPLFIYILITQRKKVWM